MNEPQRRLSQGRITLHSAVSDFAPEGIAVGFDGSRSGERVHFAILDETHHFAAPTRVEAIQSRLADLEAELADIKRFGDDTYEDGAVLTFKGDFSGAKSYSYAAIKAGGRWHLTGGKAVQNATWDAFVEFLRKANVRKVRLVVETEKVVG